MFNLLCLHILKPYFVAKSFFAQAFYFAIDKGPARIIPGRLFYHVLQLYAVLNSFRKHFAIHTINKFRSLAHFLVLLSCLLGSILCVLLRISATRCSPRPCCLHCPRLQSSRTVGAVCGISFRCVCRSSASSVCSGVSITRLSSAASAVLRSQLLHSVACCSISCLHPRLYQRWSP